MIEPTPGRVVWYRPKADEVGEAGFTLDGTQPLAAFIAFVHSPTNVNLGVLAASGDIIGRASVPLAQDRDATEGECEWMPFQKGQAGKTDESGPKIAALEQQVAALAEQLQVVANVAARTPLAAAEPVAAPLSPVAKPGDEIAAEKQPEPAAAPAPEPAPAPVVEQQPEPAPAPQPESQPQPSALDQLAQPQG